MIVKQPLTKITGESVEFTEYSNPQLSSVESQSEPDLHVRTESTRQMLKGISLNDLILQNAPISKNGERVVGFLSLDIEGGELDVLRTINFKQIQFQVLAVEHNFKKNRIELKRFLEESAGMVNILRKYSGQDYWFVHKSLLCGEALNHI